MPEIGVDPKTLPAFYDDRYGSGYMQSAQPPCEVERVRDMLKEIPIPVHSVLDYGCGAGAWIGVLSDLFADATITGLEIAGNAIGIARHRFPQAELVLFDGSEAPLPDAGFDLVFSHHVLEHVGDLRAAVADMVRLARPGGYIFACLPCGNRGSLEEWMTRQVDGGVQITESGDRRFFNDEVSHLRTLESAELIGVFGNLGAALAGQGYLHPLGALGYYSRHARDIDWVFDERHARGASARLKVRLLKLVLRALSIVTVLSDRDPKENLRRIREGGSRERLKGIAIALAIPVARPLASVLETKLPRTEWRRRRQRPERAAAQYLLFRRTR